ncbi:MAG: DMT family transporter, partial [Waterburya sp.]
VTILVGWTNMEINQSFIWSTIAGLLAALMYAIAKRTRRVIAASYAKQKLSQIPPIAIATGSQLSAAIVLLPLTPFVLPSAPPSTEVILMVLALAWLSTALAYILYFRLISNIGAGKTLIVTYISPFFAMFFGAIILGEPITISMILGCGLILTGTAIAIYT